MNKNTIGLRYNSINIKNASQDNLIEAMSIQNELMQYAYILNQEAFEMLKLADIADIIEFRNDVISFIKDLTGGKEEYRSLYGNFPNDVMSLSDFEKYHLQMVHYWSGKGFILTNSNEKEEIWEQTKYKEIRAISDEQFMKIFTDLCSVNNSLNSLDTQILAWFSSNYKKEELVFPKEIPFKENIAILASNIPQFTVKSVTDVIRVAYYFSGGDSTLPPIPRKLKGKGKISIQREEDRKKFRFNLNQEQIIRILNLFENSNLDVKEMNLSGKYGRFIRLGEIIHPGKHKKEFPKTFKAFDILRNQKRKGKQEGNYKIRSWYSLVDKQFVIGLEEGLKKLSERSGEFLRRIDYIVRNNQSNQKEIDLVYKYLNIVLQDCNNKTLWEVYTHFENRLSPTKDRAIFIKGARKKTKLPELPAINKNVVENIQEMILNSLSSKFSKLSKMGKCWIDPELKKIPAPTNMRTTSETLIPVIRGQRIPFGNENTKVVRPFVHWNDPKGHFDLDLSCMFVSTIAEKWKVLNFSNQSVYGSLHSGDVRHRKGNCAEYIDIDISNALSNSVKYVAIDLRNYNGGSLDNMNPVFGIMEREFPQANSTWLPNTISNCTKINSSNQAVYLCILDLETKEYIWLDVDGSGSTSFNSVQEIMNLIKEYTELPKLSVYDILRLHVESRGVPCSIEEADTLYKFEDFSSSYVEILKLMGI
jgi:hypothetical protein